MIATFNIDFASCEGNRTHENGFGSCDSNFVRKTIECIKHDDSQPRSQHCLSTALAQTVSFSTLIGCNLMTNLFEKF